MIESDPGLADAMGYGETWLVRLNANRDQTNEIFSQIR